VETHFRLVTQDGRSQQRARSFESSMERLWLEAGGSRRLARDCIEVRALLALRSSPGQHALPGSPRARI